MAIKFTLAAALYIFAAACIYFGTETGPAQGWPTNDIELNGCAALIVGMIAKLAGHITLLKVR